MNLNNIKYDLAKFNIRTFKEEKITIKQMDSFIKENVKSYENRKGFLLNEGILVENDIFQIIYKNLKCQGRLMGKIEIKIILKALGIKIKNMKIMHSKSKKINKL